jgi:two-component system chemotaxis response regulator CheY
MSSRRLMVVDDALIMRQRIKEIAQEAGWEVVTEAKDGEEALVKYREYQPDLVTLDIVMPGLDGVSALKQLRVEFPEARVVMVSAVNQRDKLAECIQAGALDFIVKPFEKAGLLGFFQKALVAGSRS